MILRSTLHLFLCFTLTISIGPCSCNVNKSTLNTKNQKHIHKGNSKKFRTFIWHNQVVVFLFYLWRKKKFFIHHATTRRNHETQFNYFSCSIYSIANTLYTEQTHTFVWYLFGDFLLRISECFIFVLSFFSQLISFFFYFQSKSLTKWIWCRFCHIFFQTTSPNKK